MTRIDFCRCLNTFEGYSFDEDNYVGMRCGYVERHVKDKLQSLLNTASWIFTSVM